MGVLHPRWLFGISSINSSNAVVLSFFLDITESQELLVGLVAKSVAQEAHPNKHEIYISKSVLAGKKRRELTGDGPKSHVNNTKNIFFWNILLGSWRHKE